MPTLPRPPGARPLRRRHETRSARPPRPRTPPRPPARERDGSSLLARLKPLGVFTAAVTIATAVAGLAFQLFPDLRPDPEVQTSATLAVVETEAGATYARYSRLIGRGGPIEGGSTTGNIFFVQIETKGTKGWTGLLTWCVFDAATRARSRDHHCSGVRPQPGTTSDRFVIPVWFQPPVDPGRYIIRFEYRAKGALLAIADSPTFGPCAKKSCGLAG